MASLRPLSTAISTPVSHESIISIEKNPIALDITKNQKDNPAETANALNLGEESCILNWINECDQSTL